jgi:hypothetical protein
MSMTHASRREREENSEKKQGIKRTEVVGREILELLGEISELGRSHWSVCMRQVRGHRARGTSGVGRVSGRGKYRRRVCACAQSSWAGIAWLHTAPTFLCNKKTKDRYSSICECDRSRQVFSESDDYDSNLEPRSEATMTGTVGMSTEGRQN